MCRHVGFGWVSRLRYWMKGWVHDQPAGSFEDYARALTLRHSELLLISFTLGTLAGAFVEPLMLDDRSQIAYSAGWRVAMVVLNGGGLLVARRLRSRLRWVPLGVAVWAVADAAMVGVWLANAGGDNAAWFLASYAMPLALLPMVVPLGYRVALSFGIAAAATAGYLALQPARIADPILLGAVVNVVFVGAMGVLLGDHYYRLVRSHHDQRTHMGERIADGTRRLRQLLAEIERAQDEERRRIGRELHDELAQTLTALRLEVSIAQRRTERDTPAGIGLSRIDALTDQLVGAKNRLVAALRPAPLEQLGFARAIEVHVVELAERSGLEIVLQRELDDLDLPEPAASTVYRAVQEALTNVVRHAEATRAEVRFARDGDDYRIEVADDGIGFDPAAVDGAHFGLLGLRERAAALGGAVEIASAPGHGTRLIMHVPVEPHPISRSCV